MGARRVAEARIVKAEDSDSDSESINQYTLLSVVGRGTFCKVKWAHGVDGQDYAIKVFWRGILQRQQVARFDRDGASTVSLGEKVAGEVSILERLCHPHVVALHEIIDDPRVEKLYVVLEGLPGGQLMTWNADCSAYGVTAADKSNVEIYWAEELVWGTVRAGTLADQVVCFQEALARQLFRQLLQAVAYLHGLCVVHKDLKPDNAVLSAPTPPEDPRFVRLVRLGAVSEPGVAGDRGDTGDALPQPTRGPLGLKLVDFNSAVVCEPPDCLIFDAEGTQLFTPPECFEGPSGGVHGMSRDLWSLGCTLHTMLLGRTPFWAEANIDLQLKILYEELALPAGTISEDALDLIGKLMDKSPTKRPSAASALQHAWLSGGPQAGT